MEHLQERRIVHRYLKLENVAFSVSAMLRRLIVSILQMFANVVLTASRLDPTLDNPCSNYHERQQEMLNLVKTSRTGTGRRTTYKLTKLKKKQAKTIMAEGSEFEV